MTITLKKTQARLLFVGGLSLLCLQTSLLADTATSNLQINAGLDRSLILNCSKPLTFGVWFVQSSDRTGGQTLIRVGPNVPGGLPLVDQRSGEASGVLPGPGQGECQVSGSTAPDGTELSIVFNSTVLTLNPEALLGQNRPAESGALRVERFRWRPASAGFANEGVLPKIESGTASFAIGADLIIPNNLNAANFGGYSGSITITVTEVP